MKPQERKMKSSSAALAAFEWEAERINLFIFAQLTDIIRKYGTFVSRHQIFEGKNNV